ncbi:MAG: HEAT repeat domain-containing protein [Planctomycetaceae bacterium]
MQQPQNNDRDYDSANIEESMPLPDELPPVQPPSAGFIVQLFLIPALIVIAVVGVWALFGRMAAGEQDWRELVDEIKNTNEHRRWRGANGLATLLDSDQRLAERGQNLANNPEIATALSELLREGLNDRSQREDDLKQQAFVAMTLGLSDVTGTTFPVLVQAMRPEQDRDVRMSAIKAVAVAAGRAADRKNSVSDALLVDALIVATRDEDVIVRQLGTFTLGLVPSAATNDRLAVLLGDSDESTRINAAISLARLQSTAGLDTFRKILSEAGAPTADAGNPSAAAPPNLRPGEMPREAPKLLATKNALKAIQGLAPQLTADERSEFSKLIEPIAASHPEIRLRTDATDVLLVLKSGEPAAK